MFMVIFIKVIRQDTGEEIVINVNNVMRINKAENDLFEIVFRSDSRKIIVDKEAVDRIKNTPLKYD